MHNDNCSLLFCAFNKYLNWIWVNRLKCIVRVHECADIEMDECYISLSASNIQVEINIIFQCYKFRKKFRFWFVCSFVLFCCFHHFQSTKQVTGFSAKHLSKCRLKYKKWYQKPINCCRSLVACFTIDSIKLEQIFEIINYLPHSLMHKWLIFLSLTHTLNLPTLWS